MAQTSNQVNRGVHTGGSLPVATTTARSQSFDVLEAYRRLLSEDDEMFLFAIKVLFFISWLKGAIRRCVNSLRQVWTATDPDSAADLVACDEIAYDLRPDQPRELTPFHYDGSDRFGWFGVILSHYYDEQFRRATADAPTLAEALHGATCGNYLCTYLI